MSWKSSVDAAKRAEIRELANQAKESTQEAATPVDASGSATIGARPKAANFSVAVGEAAWLSTDDLVVLLQPQLR